MPSRVPLHAVAVGPGASKYEPPPPNTAAEQGNAAPEVPGSEPPPPLPAWRTGDEQGPDAAVPVPSTAACTFTNGEPIAG